MEKEKEGRLGKKSLHLQHSSRKFWQAGGEVLNPKFPVGESRRNHPASVSPLSPRVGWEWCRHGNASKGVAAGAVSYLCSSNQNVVALFYDPHSPQMNE